MGVAGDRLPEFATQAAATPFNRTSPRPTDRDGYLAIAQDAFG